MNQSASRRQPYHNINFPPLRAGEIYSTPSADSVFSLALCVCVFVYVRLAAFSVLLFVRCVFMYLVLQLLLLLLLLVLLLLLLCLCMCVYDDDDYPACMFCCLRLWYALFYIRCGRAPSEQNTWHSFNNTHICWSKLKKPQQQQQRRLHTIPRRHV